MVYSELLNDTRMEKKIIEISFSGRCIFCIRESCYILTEGGFFFNIRVVN